jgi:tetraacyldisaccharide 4'-kinase
MDDGLQNPSLAKDLSLAVVDGLTGVGNGLVLPAGPLRAPLRTQWPHVKALVIVGDGERGAALATEAKRQGKPAMAARLSPDPEAAARLKGRRVLALAGIGRPEKFFATLEALGAEVVQRRPFPDHHAYSMGELAALAAEADRADLTLVTTEKDFLRIGPKALTLREIEVLPVRLVFEDAADMSQLVARALERCRATRPPLSRDA